jgi:hypothetical protein
MLRCAAGAFPHLHLAAGERSQLGKGLRPKRDAPSASPRLRVIQSFFAPPREPVPSHEAKAPTPLSQGLLLAKTR